MELDDFQARFAKVVRRRRLLARLNQEELAGKAGLHRTHVSISHLLAHPPTQGKSAVARLESDLMQPSFPTDQKAVNEFMEARYFNRAKKSLLDDFVTALLKVLLKADTPQLAGRGRAVLSCLVAFAIARPEQFKARMVDQLPRLTDRSDDPELRRVFRLLPADKRFWSWLSQPTRSKLEGIVQSYSYDPATVDSMLGALSVDELRPKFVARVAGFGESEREALFSRHHRPEFVDPAIDLYGGVRHFRDADRVGRAVIKPIAATPEAAMTALANIAAARMAFLAHTARVTRLVVPGCPAREVDLRGAFVAPGCNPRHGLSLVLNSDPGGGLRTRGGVREYANRWLHGFPPELYRAADRWDSRPTPRGEVLLTRFAQALYENGCVVAAQAVLPVRGVVPLGLGPLPRGELRSTANRKAAKRRGPPGGRPRDGAVYFIQDAEGVKIGFCLGEPAKRLAALQVGNPNPLRLLGHVPGPEAHERLLHRHFARYRIQGEWFPGDILADVTGILGCPSLGEWLGHQDPGLPAPAVTPG